MKQKIIICILKLTRINILFTILYNCLRSDLTLAELPLMTLSWVWIATTASNWNLKSSRVRSLQVIVASAVFVGLCCCFFFCSLLLSGILSLFSLTNFFTVDIRVDPFTPGIAMMFCRTFIRTWAGIFLVLIGLPFLEYFWGGCFAWIFFLSGTSYEIH